MRDRRDRAGAGGVRGRRRAVRPRRWRSIVGVIRLGRPLAGPAGPDRASAGGTCWPRPSATPGCCSGTRSAPPTGSSSSPSARCSSPCSPRTDSSSTLEFALPVIGHWIVYEWASEVIAWAGLVGILLLDDDPVPPPATGAGQSRFFGSRTWQGVYVELTILGIVVCVIVLRGAGVPAARRGDDAGALPAHLVRASRPGSRPSSAGDRHRGRVGHQDHHLDGLVHHPRAEHHHGRGLAPVHRLAEHLVQARGLGPAGARCAAADHGRRYSRWTSPRSRTWTRTPRWASAKVEDFTWKGLLDFTSCTECGRCQSQCPAWHTEKPLSPKLLIMDLREHAYAKAPYLQAAEAARERPARGGPRRGQPTAGRPDPGRRRAAPA